MQPPSCPCSAHCMQILVSALACRYETASLVGGQYRAALSQALNATNRRWTAHLAAEEADRLTPIVESLSSRCIHHLCVLIVIWHAGQCMRQQWLSTSGKYTWGCSSSAGSCTAACQHAATGVCTGADLTPIPAVRAYLCWSLWFAGLQFAPSYSTPAVRLYQEV